MEIELHDDTMKSAVKASALFLAGTFSYTVAADAVTIALYPDGYLFEEEKFDNAEKLAHELRNKKYTEAVISPRADIPPAKLLELLNTLQRQGIRVGFITGQAKQ